MRLTDYQNEVQNILLPSSVLRTRTGPEAEWETGARRDPNHTHWVICTDDPTKVRGSEYGVFFDKVIDFRKKLLSDPEYRHDALTKRLLCVQALNQNATARRCSGASAAKLLRDFDWLLRWRNAKSICSLSELSEEDFETFKRDAFCSDDITNLVPLKERLLELLHDKEYFLPLYMHGRQRWMRWDDFAAELGVNRLTLTQSKNFIELFKNLLPQFLEKSKISDGQLNIFRKKNQLSESKERQELRLPIWETLDRLSINNFLKHDKLIFRVKSSDFRQATTARTDVLLPNDLFRILNLAATWVLIFRHHIIKALERRKMLKAVSSATSKKIIDAVSASTNLDRPDGLPPLTLSVAAPNFDNGHLSLGRAVSFLFVACAVLIGGFAARRSGEVASLQHGCLRRVAGGLVLDIYIEKTLRDIDPVVVPEIMTEVIACLEDLSFEARADTAEPWLMQFSATFMDGQVLSGSTRFEIMLNDFLNISGLEPPSGMKHWELNFHMLRKGFVIAYYHGNLWGSFDGASRMLRHSSGDMSRIYMDGENTGEILWLRNEVVRITKIQRASRSKEEEAFLIKAKRVVSNYDGRRRDWNEGRQEFFISKYMETFDGIEEPIGKGGARMLDTLDGMVQRANARVHFAAVPTNGDDSEVRSSVLSQVTTAALDHFMEPIPGGFGYCLFDRGNSNHAATANCLRDRDAGKSPWQTYAESGVDTRPDYAFTGLHPCISCDHCAIFKKNQQVIMHVSDQMLGEMPRATTPETAKSAQQYVDDIHNLIRGAQNAVEGKQRPR